MSVGAPTVGSMTDQSSTEPNGTDHGTDPSDLVSELNAVGESADETSTAADLPTDSGSTDRTDVATPGGAPADAEVANDGDDPGAGKQGPMVSDAAIDWSTLDGGAAPSGLPTDPEPTDGNAPAA